MPTLVVVPTTMMKPQNPIPSSTSPGEPGIPDGAQEIRFAAVPGILGIPAYTPNSNSYPAANRPARMQLALRQGNLPAVVMSKISRSSARSYLLHIRAHACARRPSLSRFDVLASA